MATNGTTGPAIFRNKHLSTSLSIFQQLLVVLLDEKYFDFQNSGILMKIALFPEFPYVLLIVGNLLTCTIFNI